MIFQQGGLELLIQTLLNNNLNIYIKSLVSDKGCFPELFLFHSFFFKGLPPVKQRQFQIIFLWKNCSLLKTKTNLHLFKLFFSSKLLQISSDKQEFFFSCSCCRPGEHVEEQQQQVGQMWLSALISTCWEEPLSPSPTYWTPPLICLLL